MKKFILSLIFAIATYSAAEANTTTEIKTKSTKSFLERHASAVSFASNIFNGAIALEIPTMILLYHNLPHSGTGDLTKWPQTIFFNNFLEYFLYTTTCKCITDTLLTMINNQKSLRHKAKMKQLKQACKEIKEAQKV